MNAEPSLPRPDGPLPGVAAPQHRDLNSESRGNPPARILVVDDDPDVRRVLGSALQLFNYNVDTAGDGEGAWAALCTNSYDLLVTDHMMPKLTGLDLLRRLRAGRADLPCILISGDLPAVEGDLPSVLGPGRAVEKPVKLERLVTMVRSLLSAHPIGKDVARSGDGRATFCPA